MKLSPQIKFLIRNGLKGLGWLIIILGAYFVFRELVISNAPDAWMEKVYARPMVVYVTYIFSEFFFGLIPPELFMIWAINKDTLAHYFYNLVFFAGVSYLMGYVAFLIGKLLHKRSIFTLFRRKFLRESWPLLNKYGIFLIIVAALTPIPWAAVCLLVGSAGYPSGRFLKYALFRILRFAVYGYIIFQTHQL